MEKEPVGDDEIIEDMLDLVTVTPYIDRNISEKDFNGEKSQSALEWTYFNYLGISSTAHRQNS